MDIVGKVPAYGYIYSGNITDFHHLLKNVCWNLVQKCDLIPGRNLKAQLEQLSAKNTTTVAYLLWSSIKHLLHLCNKIPLLISGLMHTKMKRINMTFSLLKNMF